MALGFRVYLEWSPGDQAMVESLEEILSSHGGRNVCWPREWKLPPGAALTSLETAASGPSGHPQSTADESRGRAAACRREGQSLARSPGLCHSGMQLKS